MTRDDITFHGWDRRQSSLLLFGWLNWMTDIGIQQFPLVICDVTTDSERQEVIDFYKDYLINLEWKVTA